MVKFTSAKLQKSHRKKRENKVAMVSYHAVRCLMKVAKSIKVNLMRKKLRKYRELAKEVQEIKEKGKNDKGDGMNLTEKIELKKNEIERYLQQLKELSKETLEKTCSKLFDNEITSLTNSNSTSTSTTSVSQEHEDAPQQIIKDIVTNKLMLNEIQSWKHKITEIKQQQLLRQNKKLNEKEKKVSKDVKLKSSIHSIHLNKKDRTTALFMDCLADGSDEDNNDDNNEDSVENETNNNKNNNNKKNNNKNPSQRISNSRQPLRGNRNEWRRPESEVIASRPTHLSSHQQNNLRNGKLKRLREKPEMDVYKPVNERITTSSSLSEYVAKKNNTQVNSAYSSTATTAQSSFQNKNLGNQQSRAGVSVPKSGSGSSSLHPSWAAKKKLKQEANKITLLPTQGNKIRFEENENDEN